MAISDKLTYLNETKTKLKTAINNLGGAIASSDTFRSYVNVLDNIYKYLPKVSGEDTIINLDNTIGAKMEFQLKGNTSQSGTPTPANPIEVNVVTGNNTIITSNKNLFELMGETHSGSVTVTQNNNEFQLTWTGGFNVYLQNIVSNLDSSKTYTVSFKHKGESLDLRNGSATVQTIRTGTNTDYTLCSANITDITSFEFHFIRSSGTTSTAYIKDFQIEVGTSATDYVEHEEIVNEINLGKNLISSFAKKSATANQILFNNATEYTDYIFKAGTYTFSYKDTNNCNLYMRTATTSNTNLGTAKTITITSAEDFNIWLYRSGITETELSEIQLEKGTQATSYSPYFEPIELCKIRDYQDYIFKNNGKWYLHKVTSKIRLDGTEDWQIKHSGTANYYYSALLTSKLLPAEVNYVYYLSNYYVSLSKVSGSDTDEGFKLLPEGYIRIRYGTESSVADFKAFLASNNVLLYSPITNGTDTEITNTELINQLEALNSSYSYTEQTNISQENSDLPIIIYASTLMGNVEA